MSRILLATDGSEDSQRAVKTAIGLSTKLDSELHVVYVAPEYPYLHAYYSFLFLAPTNSTMCSYRA